MSSFPVSPSAQTEPETPVHRGTKDPHAFNTVAVHAGNYPDKETGAIVPPVYLTSTYVQDYPNQPRSCYDYTRAGNPNFTRLEEQIAALEGSKYCVVVASGLSAFTAVFTHLVQSNNGEGKVSVAGLPSLYGGTHRLLSKIFDSIGVNVVFAKKGDWSSIEDALSGTNGPKPKAFVLESPTNPLLECVDLSKLCRLRDELNPGCLIIADNTFATPYHQLPLRHGVDVVIHSSTKYLGGHSDVVGGALLTNDALLHKSISFNRMAMGFNPSPFDAWLLSRSIKTLGLRVSRQSSNALQLAEWLEAHPMVKQVLYPGLPSHPDHEIAKRQMMNGFGGVLSVEFNMTCEETKQLLASDFSVISLAESLGCVETLVDHPASMTHASIDPEKRAEIGLSDGLVRVSVGVEDVQDIIDDWRVALAKMKVA